MRELAEKGKATGVSLDVFAHIFKAFLGTMEDGTLAMIQETLREAAGQSQEEKLRYLQLVQMRKAPLISQQAMAAAKGAAAARGVATWDEEVMQCCMALYSDKPELRPIVKAHRERLAGFQHLIMG